MNDGGEWKRSCGRRLRAALWAFYWGDLAYRYSAATSPVAAAPTPTPTPTPPPKATPTPTPPPNVTPTPTPTPVATDQPVSGVVLPSTTPIGNFDIATRTSSRRPIRPA